MNRWCSVAVAAVVVTLTGGCSGHEIDRAAWQWDLKAAGVTVTDWDKLERTVLDLCDDNDSELRTFVAISRDAGNPSTKQMEVDFAHACPDQLDALHHAIGEVQRASDEYKVACAVPESERTQEQRDMVAAVGGCR